MLHSLHRIDTPIVSKMMEVCTLWRKDVHFLAKICAVLLAKICVLYFTIHNCSYQQVRNWVLRYEKMGAAGLEDRRGRRAGTQPARTPEEELRDKIAELERRNRDLQMENDVLTSSTAKRFFRQSKLVPRSVEYHCIEQN